MMMVIVVVIFIIKGIGVFYHGYHAIAAENKINEMIIN